jgi:subtilisin family serine protease
MSFGLEEYHPGMHEAIARANHNGIILFAAASNEGGTREVTYPAKHDEVVCVFSTDGHGNSLGINPTPMEKSGYNFATLGQAVKSAWPTTLQEGEEPERRKTGTSFATPIAAGVAACLLEFALMSDLDDGLYKILRRHQGMQAVFAKHLCGEGKRGELHHVHPWALFGGNREPKVILTLLEDSLGHLTR